MARYTYRAYYKDNEQAATGSGTKKQIEALAMLISHPNVGVGRPVCVYRFDFRSKKLVSCWRGGQPETTKKRG